MTFEIGKRIAGRWQVVAELYSEDFPRYRVAGVDGAVAELLVLDSVDEIREHLPTVKDIVHDNIIRSYEAGTWLDQHYYVRELLAMEPLLAWFRRNKPLEEEQVAAIGCQLALVIKELHAVEFQHCGFSFDTVHLTGDGFVKIDPLEKYFRKPAEDVSISPEESGNGGIGPRSDMYRAGMLMAQMMLNDTYDGDSRQMLQVIHGEGGDELLSRPFRDALKKLTERNPRDRYVDGEEMLDALHAALGGSAGRKIEAAEDVPTSWYEDKRFWLYSAILFFIIVIFLMLIEVFWL